MQKQTAPARGRDSDYNHKHEKSVLDEVVKQMGKPKNMSNISRAVSVFDNYWRVNVYVTESFSMDYRDLLVNRLPEGNSWFVKRNEDGSIESRTSKNGTIIPIERIY
jgi:anionic cell wall polymer biosynthesis LytR-Cps2A-Psr (LCP) family protein